MSDDLTILRMLKEIEDLKLPDAEAIALTEDLNLAERINGDPDPTRGMFKRMLLSNARQTLLLHKSLRKLSVEHMQQCPVMKAAKNVNGVTVMPWEFTVTGGSDSAADAEGQSSVTIPLINITVKGRAARYVGASVAALVLVVAILLTNAATRKSVIADVAAAYRDKVSEVDGGE